MDWIEAALAFAVVMMLLSTAVTVIMEAAHNLLRIREKGLRRLVEGVYENVVVPRLPRLAGDASAAGFVETVTGARYLPVSDVAPPAEKTSWFGRVKRWFKHVVYRTVNATQLKELNTLEFVERLAETPAGRRLFEESQRRGEVYLDTFLGDLASKFEDFSRSSSEYFARRARLTSTMIAIALAFSINVSAVQVYEALLLDKDLRVALIDRGDEVGEQALAAEQRLAKIAENTEPAEFDKAQFDKDVEEIKSIVGSLTGSGLPIGWSSAPWNAKAWAGHNAWMQAFIVAGWALSVLLAGLLVGLGGPFWFNVFKKLGALAGSVRGAQTPVQKQKEGEQAPADDDNKTITRVFTQAAMADALADPAGRALLTPDGRVDPADSQ